MKTLEEIRPRLRDPVEDKHDGSLWAYCPCHDDGAKQKRRSLHVSQGDGRLLYHCFAGCRFEDIIQALDGEGSQRSWPARESVYQYTDAEGHLLYEVIRIDGPDGKTFRQRQPDGNGGCTWSTKGMVRVPYRLPEVRKAIQAGEKVFIVEGEKCAEALGSIGLTATCNDGGAGKWKPEHAQHLRGANVVILPDNDRPGKDHAEAVARSLSGVAKTIRIVTLPDLPEKGDVVDWMAAGHHKDELLRIVEVASAWKPGPEGQKALALELTCLADLLQEPDELVSWTVEGLLPSGGFSILAGKPKAGKSTLARELALRIAQGEPFLERATDQGPVIYLALEEKRAEVRRHFRDMGADGTEEIHIFTATAPKDALPRVRQSVEELKPSLLIVDPLFRLARVKDDKAYAETTQALEPLLALAREAGTHVLVAHHMRKGVASSDPDGILGSVAIFGSVDTALILRRTEQNRTLCSDQRYGENLPETVLVFDPESRTTTLGGTREQQQTTDMKDSILSFLDGQSDWMTEPGINAEVDGKTGLQRKALRELVKYGEVLREGAGAKGDPFRYASRNARFLVPSIYGEQGNKSPKDAASTELENGNSCSQENQKTENDAKTREQAFSTPEEQGEDDVPELWEVSI